MIKRIVLTGGPGSGKTTVLDRINQAYTEQGYRVVIIDETATYLIEKGIRPFGERSMNIVDFQEIVMKLQLAKEEIFDRAIELLGEENVLIIYDRGAIDNSAYVTKEQFQEVLARLNHVKTFADLLNRYDLVIDLVGRKDFYTTENNKARSEDPDTALKLGETTLKSWLGHSKIKIVMPKDRMEEKIQEVLNVINESLNKKQIKKQEKYLVDLQETDISKIIEEGRGMHIEQTYLQSNGNIEKRLRRVCFNNCVSYYLNVFQIMEDGTKEIISGKQLDEKMYKQLLEFKDNDYETIHKTRYFFSHNGEYLYLDIFDDNYDLGILEANVTEDNNIEIPEYISVLENVTKNNEYYNRNIAAKSETPKHKTLVY